MTNLIFFFFFMFSATFCTAFLSASFNACPPGSIKRMEKIQARKQKVFSMEDQSQKRFLNRVDMKQGSDIEAIKAFRTKIIVGGNWPLLSFLEEYSIISFLLYLLFGLSLLSLSLVEILMPRAKLEIHQYHFSCK
jgi:hypothetical protein